MPRYSRFSKGSISRRTATVYAFALISLGLGGPAHAQKNNWPNKPIRLVVGFAPGGGTDVMARSLAQALTEELGQTVVVDNKPGGSGSLSASDVSRSAPDGYTFLVAPTSVETVNPSLFNFPLQPARDLTPVMGIGRMQMFLLAKPSLEVSNVEQLIALAKSQPGKLNYASAGAATPPHLAGELFNQATGIQTTHIPYKGSAPALQDVMAGQADLVFDPGVAVPHIKSGKIKLLAIASDRKSSVFPQVPSYADLGIDNAGLDIWFGIWAPNKVPPELLERFSQASAKVLRSQALKDRYASLSAEATALDGPAFRQLLQEETATLSKLIKERQIIAD